MADVLNADALHHGLDQLDGWEGDLGGIRKTWKYRDFAEAMVFTNRVAELAEAAGHHPDIDIRWNEVTLTFVTHSAGGVTQQDLEMAEQVDRALS